MTILFEDAELILYQALEAQVGIQVRVVDWQPENSAPVVAPTIKARSFLYQVRKELGDVELEDLEIHLCPSDPDQRLWLIKKEKI